MTDIIGHPWMQGPHATHAEVKEEFADRHQKVNAARQAEAEKNKIERTQHAAHKGAGNKVYLELGELEETKNNNDKMLEACPFKYAEGKNT